MKSEEIIKLIDDQRDRLSKLPGEEIGGFALIVPMEGEPIDVLLLGKHVDLKSFYTTLADQISLARGDGQLGGVGVPGMPRRR